MKRMSFAVLFVLFFLAYADSYVFAGTYTAASCNRNDVNAVINGPTHTAVDGDTVNIPAGSCTWSSGVTVPSHIGITITGSGTPDSSSSTRVPSSSCSSGTTITLSTATAFTMRPQYGNSTTRLSCMSINYGGNGAVGFRIPGTCAPGGCPNLRMDNLTFSNWTGHTGGTAYGIGAVNNVFGVIDHNQLNGASLSGGMSLAEISLTGYKGDGMFGDNSWAQPENYGSADFLFFENNTFNYASAGDNESPAETGGANEGGGRVVVRYNTFALAGSAPVPISWHGSESSGRPRSGRTWEFYNNTMTCVTGTQCLEEVGSRGGTGLTWGNNITGSGAGLNAYTNLDTYRVLEDIGGWGACDGSSVYDTNDGVTYYSDTIASVTYTGGSSYTITVSGTPGWSPDYWTAGNGPAPLVGGPYSVHDVTRNNGSEIRGNGANTLSVTTWKTLPYIAGDSIQILRATVCFDQAGGRGAGVHYSGISISPSVSANQVVSPTYSWMMGGINPSHGVVSAGTARVIANRDWYAESANQTAQTSPTSPFNGSSGMGHGTLANRPTSCTAGVGYWATDQGSWNTSGSGGQGQLYLCTSTNSWTLSYTPYTYPHPLTIGTTDNATAPTGLQAIVQ